ncbi:MAG: DUF2619 domain-containing protein [Bacillota bacterium]
MNRTVLIMFMIRFAFGLFNLAAAAFMLRLGRVDPAVRINALIGSIGPLVFLLVSAVGAGSRIVPGQTGPGRRRSGPDVPGHALREKPACRPGTGPKGFRPWPPGVAPKRPPYGPTSASRPGRTSGPWCGSRPSVAALLFTAPSATGVQPAGLLGLGCWLAEEG